ncbi:PREDICTED: sacsin-like [Amphimedon queenslandica]|uniref:HEPN domain-containing protein n=2 Tax=Amphimedon queenslandica TaxID=400682 RepID=A0AAN0JMN8_AMPQE|nr:PREDICTED: sacsin-like [Amphimedon queenslandica]|eukprot:XP_019858269.1 PREDICTED: sacsin-like [Amphimedon queenslandica]
MTGARLRGEEFGQRVPPIFEIIKSILLEYPSGQIFKEILQNADDARATKVKFYLDCRDLQTLPPSLLEESDNSEILKRFTGPALLSYNNAPFKEEDWESIKTTYQSVKAGSPHKVGKFGIGFNTVYHITDLPVIVSEDTCVFLEPQESVWIGKPGQRYSLKDLNYYCPEALESLNGICEFSNTLSEYKGKAMFRFPLRNTPSKMWNELYDISKVESLLSSLKEEAKYMLLFLRSVCSIEVFKINTKGDILSIFNVSITDEFLSQHICSQQRFLCTVESLFTNNKSDLKQCSQTHLDCNQFNVAIDDYTSYVVHEWLVVHQVGSNSQEVLELAEKQSVLPWVGVAVELNTLPTADGRIFCALPLPVEDKSPFKVHVNGSFAVGINRRSVKWIAQERRHDEQALWNKMLVEKCLPSCYFKLVSELMAMPSVDVYSYWPDMRKVSGTSWSGLLEPFYKLLFSHSKVVYTQLNGGEWINIEDAVILKLNDDVPKAVCDALFKCNLKLVFLSISCNEVVDRYYTGARKVLSPSLARFYLRGCGSSYINVTRQDKLAILRYCLADYNYADLYNLQLLPLADGSFKEFRNKIESHTELCFLSSLENPSNLLCGLENILVRMYHEDEILHSNLVSVAHSGQTQLAILNTVHVAELLSKCNTSLWSRDQIALLWQWINKKDLSLFYGKLILPVQLPFGKMDIVPFAKQTGVVHISLSKVEPISDLLIACLRKCGVKFADSRDFTFLSHVQLSEYLYQFVPDQVLDAIKFLDFRVVDFSCDEAHCLQHFFSNFPFDDQSKFDKFSGLPLFKVLQFSGSTLFSFNSIKTYDNQAIAMKGRYDFETHLISVKPLVIDTTYSSCNNEYLLKKLHNANLVCFMGETEYLKKIAFWQIKSEDFKSKNIVPFMLSVLCNFSSPHYRQQLAGALNDLPFIKVSTFHLFKSPSDLFDPENELIKELISDQCKFPGTEFQPYLPILRQSGLKSSVDASGIFEIVTSIKELSFEGIVTELSSVKYSKAIAVLLYLTSFPYLLNDIISLSSDLQLPLVLALTELSPDTCWLPVANRRPRNYPSCLEWKGSQHLSCLVSVRPRTVPLVLVSGDLSSSDLPLIVGSKALFVERAPTELVELVCCSQALLPVIVSHFKDVIQNQKSISNKLLLQISLKIYSYLQDNKMHCSASTFSAIDNWVFIKNKFLSASQVALEANPSIEVDLEPFLYLLPSNLEKFKDIFTIFGMNNEVTSHQIISVLCAMNHVSHHQITSRKAWSIVTAILEWLAEDSDRMIEGNILVPVESKSSYPQLFPIKEVAYSDNEVLRKIANASGEDYYLIHPKVFHLSAKLGLTPLSDQLNITEDIFDDAGQHEPIITRLCNILKEYKDGLSILKEMIQNADDAGATEVNILYDNRKHSTKNLIFKGMADSHGPALIVHNNSTFAKEDFENITKLAGTTKANQPLKIGQFGIGFCSVYHVTDVPSFVSAEWLYIFDPTLNYLKDIVQNQSRPGKKIKYQSKILANTDHLVPYDGLFGFKSSSNYNGTLFRLPFRTSASQISSTIYNDHLVEDMKRDLVNWGSKLLLFLQHVKRITFSDFKGTKKMLKVSIDRSRIADIRHFVVTFSPQQKCITEHWLIADAEEQQQSQNSGISAVASVACQLDKVNLSSYKCKKIKGSAFCFLPLALPSTGLPVHISANFAIMSNRTGIWTKPSLSTVSDFREQWNKKLMETTIPAAYCKLLQKLQEMHCSGKLLNYEFYMLWPLSASLNMMYPWIFLVTPLINLLSEQELFYSASLNRWQTLAQSNFIPSSLFQDSIAGDATFLDEALYILQLPVVSLPASHMLQLQELFDNDIVIINEDSFTNYFLSKIKVFDAHIVIRNKVIYTLLLTISMSELTGFDKLENFKNQLRTVPCIPCSPDGVVLKLPSQLIDPGTFHDMFDPDDSLFPFSDFCQNNPVCYTIMEMGMMSRKLPWDIIIKSAQTIKLVIVIDENKAMKRVKAILKCINSAVPDELKETSFLPVLPKPEHYFLPWKGEGHVLLSPTELMCDLRMGTREAALIVGSQRAILNTNSVNHGGCGSISQRVIKLLEIPTMPSFDEVLHHFNTLVSSFTAKLGNWDIVGEICCYVYQYFNDSLENPIISQLLLRYCNKPFIWTGKIFVCPCDVAVNWKHEDGPFLYKLPSKLCEYKNLLKCLKIKENFTYDDILLVFRKMYELDASHKIPKKNRNVTLSMILELNLMSICPSNVSSYERVILVDDCYTLRYVNQLSFNDVPWLTPDKESFFVHNKLSRDVALTLGVKPTCSRFMNKFIPNVQQNFAGAPFGQKEELTQRIRNVLNDYPLDATLLKELIQNADDAKANKILVILDKRQHGKERVPSVMWGKELQGPALLVWNDKDFSDDDLKGIQRLGLGSKCDDDESIGQFGIGFNVVYHLTDCPSFITRGNKLCIFDPHCRYVPEADHSCPGRQYNISNVFFNTMLDLKSSFLRDSSSSICLHEDLTSGTLFRLPLRTHDGFESTELLDKTFKRHIAVRGIEEKLFEWVHELEHSLLFLNHLEKFSFYVLDDCRCSFKLGYEIEVSQENQLIRESFHRKLCSFKISKDPFIVTYPMQLKLVTSDNRTTTKKWLIQNGVGDASRSPREQLSHNKIWPRHGIAAPLDRNNRLLGHAFCFLPLPAITNLPIQINGQFALSSNRRSLWLSNDKNDNKTVWNKFILKAIAYSYAVLLEKIRPHMIRLSEYDGSRHRILSAIKSYYDLFPLLKIKLGTDFLTLEGKWHTLAIDVMQHLHDYNLPVLAIEIPKPYNRCEVMWCPLRSDDEFRQVYFTPEKIPGVVQLMKKLNMLITLAPYSIYKSFERVYKPSIVSPMSVFCFYTKFSEQILTTSEPLLLHETPFQTIKCFRIFLAYILSDSGEFPRSPYGYPLLLTSDGILRKFNEAQKVFVSKCFSLFSRSKDKFLHRELLHLPLSSSYFLTPDSCSYAQISILLCRSLPLVMKEKEAPISSIKSSILKELWKCFSENEFFVAYQKEIVQNWALLPSDDKLYSSSSEVLPIVEPDNVMHDVFDVLKELHVPVLKSDLISPVILKYCPSMEHYNDILKVIFHVCKQNEECFTKIVKEMSDGKINNLLLYLRNTSFHNDQSIFNKLMYLPLFKGVDGLVTKLLGKHIYLWPDADFPLIAYDKWAPIESIVFLEKNGSWKYLCSTIHSLFGEDLSSTEVYCEIIFPIFNQLSFKERKVHMAYIRQNIFPNLKHALRMKGEQNELAKKFVNCAKGLNFLVCQTCTDRNVLYPVNHFVDHTMDIFNIFSDRFHFLDTEYRKEQWLDFLMFVGLCSKVTAQEFIDFCTQVSESKSEEASHVLVDYLFSNKASDFYDSPDLLAQIGNISFVCTADLSSLSWIASPCTSGFTSFKGAAQYTSYASLLWTVRPLINLPKDCCSAAYDDDVLSQLQVLIKPTVDEVFQNIINISNSDLADFRLMSTYNLPTLSEGYATFMVNVIKENIKFIQDHNSHKLKELSFISFIPVSAEPAFQCIDNHEINKPVLVNPLQVVMSVTSLGSERSTRFCPYINNLPNCLSDLYSALSIAGVTLKVELKHVQYMLERLHHQCKVINSPNDRKLVRDAMQTLFSLLKDDVTLTAAKILDPLYLPSLNNELVLSTKLVYLDRKVYYNNVASWDFSQTNFALFHIPLYTYDAKLSETELCHKLPTDLSPKPLSFVSYDMLESCTVLQSQSKLVERLKIIANLCSGTFYSQGLVKIFMKALPSLSEQKAALFVDFIKDLEFKTIAKLTSSVIIDFMRVGAVGANFMFLFEDGKYTFYGTDSITTIDMTLLKDLSHEICIVLARLIKYEAVLFSKEMFQMIYKLLNVQSENDFKLFMEDFHQDVLFMVDDENLLSVDDSLPEPGQPMKSFWKSFLDQDVNNVFRPQEWVGYEKSYDYFVWAIILHQVHQEDINNPFLRKYAIQIDNKEDLIEEVISVLSLYKLVRREAPAPLIDSQEIALHNGIHLTFNEANEGEDMCTLKRKVCEQLRLLWLLPDFERNRGLKRLYLLYHPDKAETSLIKLHEEIFKYLKCQINRLEKKLPLLDLDIPDAMLHSQATTVRHKSDWESNFNKWDESARNAWCGGGIGVGVKLSSEWAKNFSSFQSQKNQSSQESASSFNFQPQVDLIEAKRWIRQAKSDLKALKYLSSSYDSEVSSQVIFMAHQVMEKSLKAGMYALLGLNEIHLKYHQLNVPARALGSFKVSLLPLTNLVLGMEQYYTSTRYPNKHSRPNAPVDKYNFHLAADATKCAEKVYNLICIEID